MHISIVDTRQFESRHLLLDPYPNALVGIGAQARYLPIYLPTSPSSVSLLAVTVLWGAGIVSLNREGRRSLIIRVIFVSCLAEAVAARERWPGYGESFIILSTESSVCLYRNCGTVHCVCCHDGITTSSMALYQRSCWSDGKSLAAAIVTGRNLRLLSRLSYYLERSLWCSPLLG